MLSPDYSKRDYLLPEGCKDLIDVIRLEQRKEQVWLFKKPKLGPWSSEMSQLGASEIPKLKLGELPGMPPPIKGEIEVSGQVTAKQLAELLGQKPYHVIADLMMLGVFSTLNQVLSFEAISKVARQHGFKVRKTG